MTLTLSPEQAAKVAKVSRGTINNAVRSGALQAQRDNRNRWRIKEEDLRAWLEVRPSPTDKVSDIGSVNYQTEISKLTGELSGAREVISRQDDEIRFLRSTLEREQSRRWWNMLRKS
jgi:excisionase family DNA binding protein